MFVSRLRRGHASGFSLVELSVVLMIISITLAGALDLSINVAESEKIETTEERIARIERAMEDYVFREKRLPCPAGAALRSEEANYGTGGAITPGAGAQACPNASHNDGTIYAGAVPVRDLGLSDKYMLDGWDRRFLYAVDNTFANNETTNTNCDSDDACFFRATTGGIRIETVAGGAISSDAAYAVVSHGNNGLGAYNAFGAKGASTGRLADPPVENTGEIENAEPGASGLGAFDNVFVQDDKSDTFDDIVSYRPKWRISSDAKGLESDEWTTCEAAADPDATCTGVPDPPGETACRAMAEAVYRFCIDFNG